MKMSRHKPSKTKLLARRLGLLPSKRKLDNVEQEKPRKKRKEQLLTYLLVIDFESTCWKNKKGRQEIIEFPAVLLELSSGKILSEFHHYVTPFENPTLSPFCNELTGITQAQVNSGIPLPTCLYAFNQWVKKLRDEMGVVLMEPEGKYTEEESLCAIATWSDWDLGVCLNYECNRKQIKKRIYFEQWIDIRALYKSFYERSPAGLSGAMEDLGILFAGRQHSGIDDARNTARLCYRMVRDGCRLTITKCIHKETKFLINPPSDKHNTFDDKDAKVDLKSDQGESKLMHLRVDDTNQRIFLDEMINKQSLDSLSGNAKLISGNASCAPVTMKPGVTADGERGSQENWEDVGNDFLRDVADEMEKWSEDGDDKQLSYLSEGHGRPNRSDHGITRMKKWSENEDKQLPSRHNRPDQVITTMKKWSRNGNGDKNPPPSLSPMHSTPAKKPDHVIVTDNPLIHGNASSVATRASLQGSTTTPSRSEYITHVMTPVTLLSLQPPTLTHKAGGFYGTDKGALICEKKSKASSRLYESPSVLSCEGKAAVEVGRATGDTPPLFSEPEWTKQSPRSSHNGERNNFLNSVALSAPVNNSTSPSVVMETPPLAQGFGNTVTPLLSTKNKNGESFFLNSKESAAVSPMGNHFRTPSTEQWLQSKNSFFSPNNRTSNSPILPCNGGKITPPLCGCGKRAKRKLVCTPGPNEGKPFYVCPNGNRGSDCKKGCDYFKWERYASDCSRTIARPLASDYGD